MSASVTLLPGDLLKIERRYLVDGVPTCVTDKGRYAGIQIVGSAEHIALQAPKGKQVRLFPLHSVSEITLVKPVKREAPLETAAPARPWDPSVL